MTPGHGQDEPLDVGLSPVEQRVDRFRCEVEPVGRRERGERSPRGLRLAQPGGKRLAAPQGHALEAVPLRDLTAPGAGVLRLVLEPAEGAARRAVPVAELHPGALALEAQALLAGHGLDADGLHGQPQQPRRGESRAGARRAGRQRLDLVEEGQPLARGLARGGPGQERRARGREPARLGERRSPFREALDERRPLRLQPVAAAFPVTEELGPRAIALDADAPRPGALGEHQHVVLPLRLRPRVDARRADAPLQPLPIDEVVAGLKVVAQDGRRGPRRHREGHQKRGRRGVHAGGLRPRGAIGARPGAGPRGPPRPGRSDRPSSSRGSARRAGARLPSGRPSPRAPRGGRGCARRGPGS